MFEQGPVAKKLLTYEDAVLYCMFLEYNGYNDWRLPTKDEFDIMHKRDGSWCWDASDLNGRDHSDGELLRTIPVRSK